MRSICSKHTFYPIIYAFLAHEHLRVRDDRARQERVLDGRAIDGDVVRLSAPTCVRDAAGPCWPAVPRLVLRRSVAAIFHCVCTIAAQMPQKRRERHILLEPPRSCCRSAVAAILRSAARPASARTAVPPRKSRRRVIHAAGTESPSREAPRKNVLDNVPPDQREAAQTVLFATAWPPRSDRRQRQSRHFRATRSSRRRSVARGGGAMRGGAARARRRERLMLVGGAHGALHFWSKVELLAEC